MPWKKFAHTRKFIEASSISDLNKRLEEAAYAWKPISPVFSRNGKFEVLVEVKDLENVRSRGVVEV